MCVEKKREERGGGGGGSYIRASGSVLDDVLALFCEELVPK